MLKKQKIKWKKLVTRPTFNILWAEPFVCGIDKKIAEKYGVALKNVLLIPAGEGTLTLYEDESSLSTLGKKIISIIKKKRNFISEHSKECYAICGNLIESCRGISEANVKKSSNKELWKLFLLFYEKMANYAVLMTIPIIIESFVTEEIRKIMKELLRN